MKPIFAPLIPLVLLLLGAPLSAEPIVMRIWPQDRPATQPFDPTDVQTIHNGDAQHVFVSNIRWASIQVFLPSPAASTGVACVICPGGGYQGLAMAHEGSLVAMRLARHGIAGIVLKYRLPDSRPPARGALPLPQQDVLRTMQVVRAHAAEWKLEENKIGVMGFSAGGHLAATAATMFDHAPSLAPGAEHDAASACSARPDFAVLLYPVITMGPLTHQGSLHHLLGSAPDPQQVDRFSVEKHLTPQTPPLFVVAAEDDDIVPVANSTMLASAAAAARLPCELILLHAGGHGFGMGKPGSEAAVWFDAMLEWMKDRRLLPPATR